MIQFNIEWTISDLENIFLLFTKAAFPTYTATMEKSAHQVGQAWRDFLSGADNLDIKLPKDAKVNANMLKSIKEETIDGTSWRIHSENQQMEALIKGTPPVHYDMKQTHPYGRKSRVSLNKDGSIKSYYLIVPFRWATPNEKGTDRAHSFFSGVIPKKEYNVNVLGMDISSRTSKIRFEKNARGENIGRSRYEWKDRLEGWDSRSAGMVRMEDYGINKAGEVVKKSTYFTFRVISSESPQNSWWYSRHGSEGIDLRGALHRKFDTKIKNALDEALENDIKMLTES